MIKNIGLLDLPQETYITFGKLIFNSKGDLIDIKESRELLLDLAKYFMKKCSNVKRVSKEIGIPSVLIFKILKFKKKIRLEYLLKILNYLRTNGVKKYIVEYLQKYVYSISSLHGRSLKPFIKNNGKIERKFPFEFNTISGIKCLTFPLSDGYINKSDDNYIRIGYTNSNVKLHKDLIKNIRATFGDVSYSFRKISRAYETYFTGILGKIYTKSLGFKYGGKVKNNVSLPSCLISLEDHKLIGALVSQFIDDEGHFSNGQIDICIAVDEEIPNPKNFNKEICSPNLLKDIKILLKRMGIYSHYKIPYPYFDKSQNKIKWTYHLQINEFRNVTKLYPYLSLIKDDNKIKIQNHLNKLQGIYNRLCKNFNKKSFQVSDIIFLLNISKRSALNYIRTFKRAKLIKLIEKGKYISNKGTVTYENAKYTIANLK